ncbi:MAG: hypothetical protein JWL98_330, partial [Xanthomonadaceae bacterium]|nr:hypothetical protein [Xanthomonadaceae bacterium]
MQDEGQGDDRCELVVNPRGWEAGLPGWKTVAGSRIFDPFHPFEFPEFDLSQFATAQAPRPITLYTSALCGYCSAAKNFLRSKGLEWTEVRIDLDPAERERMLARARRTTVPQIFFGDTHVGG